MIYAPDMVATYADNNGVFDFVDDKGVTDFVVDGAATPIPPPNPTPVPPLAPSIAISSPPNGYVVKGQQSVKITSTASAAGTITITINGVLQATVINTTSCSFTWPGKSITKGAHVIASKVVDGLQRTATASVSIRK
jgi:hypothetical protein